MNDKKTGCQKVVEKHNEDTLWNVELCEHPNPLPYEIKPGVLRYLAEQEGKENTFAVQTVDWTCNVINATVLRVISYWCPMCSAIIESPNPLSDE